jgi:GT2 family glycosyltransferase
MMSEEVITKPVNSSPVSRSSLQGAITGLYGDVLHGWALDVARLDERLVVEVMVDGACVALVRADLFEPAAGHGDQFHGFGVQLRQTWLDGARHISARIANQNFQLEGDIQMPAAPSKEPAAIASQVWHSGGLRLSGWSFDPDAPQRHVQLSVREDDRVLAKASCDTHHQALVYRSTTDHGFTIDLPWELADGKPHTLHVENDMGHALSGSPIKLCCWPEGLEGLLKQHDHHGPDEQTLALLTEVAKEQTMRSPKSAGFQHYPQWFEVFQHTPPRNLQPKKNKVGVLLLGEGDTTQEGLSLASLRANKATPLKIARTHTDDLLPALNSLLQAGCDCIVPVRAGDHLASRALDHLTGLLEEDVAWGYADCDRDGPEGERTLPWLKPVWDVDLFIGADIFTPGAIFSTDIVQAALSLLAPANELQSLNWDFLIAGIVLATEKLQAGVVHLPQVLYHRDYRAPASPEQGWPSMDRHQAIAWLCQCLAPGATVKALPQFPALLRAHWPLPLTLPRVSLIVPTRDQVGLLRTCIEGLLNTDYPYVEIIVVDNQSTDPQTLEYLRYLPTQGVKVLPHPHPFNYSTINNRAVEHATGEIIGLVNNDIEIIETHWLKEMVSQLLRDNVGAVGAKLLWPNRMVQHGGVVVGINGLAAHAGNNLEEHDAGYLATNQLTRRQSAVTAACLLMRKSVFEDLGGLDEKAFPVAFNDVDLCLRIQKSGLNLIWTAFAKLIHAESASRGKDISAEKRARAQREQQGFIERWSLDGQIDPHYHPALSHDYLSGAYGGLALPQCDKSPRARALRSHTAESARSRSELLI